MRPLHTLPMLFLLSLSASAPALDSAEEDVFYPTAFAPVFREGAVLQRECVLPVWGTAKPGSAVAVFLDAAIAYLLRTAHPQGAGRPRRHHPRREGQDTGGNG